MARDVHKHHHVFYNPTPFAVIADEWMDQFIRSMPMIILVRSHGVKLLWCSLSCYVWMCGDMRDNTLWNSLTTVFLHHVTACVDAHQHWPPLWHLWDTVLWLWCLPSLGIRVTKPVSTQSHFQHQVRQALFNLERWGRGRILVLYSFVSSCAHQLPPLLSSRHQHHRPPRCVLLLFLFLLLISGCIFIRSVHWILFQNLGLSLWHQLQEPMQLRWVQVWPLVISCVATHWPDLCFLF